MYWTTDFEEQPMAAGGPEVTQTPVDLDLRRGMSAQRATELRRLAAEVEAEHIALRRRQEQLEQHLVDRPAESWPEAADKARYLLGLLAVSGIGGDARMSRLIAAVLADFDRLSES